MVLGQQMSDQAAKGGTARRPVRIFQSYGWRDATPVAERLRHSLTALGYDVWLDRDHLRADDRDFSLALEDALRECDVVLALMSPHSVRGEGGADRRSSICYNELRFAEELAKPILPVRVLPFGGATPFLVIKYRRLDMTDWEEPAYGQAVQDIAALIDRAVAGESLLDPEIVFQAPSFTSQLRSVGTDFVGREWLFGRIDDWLGQRRTVALIEGPPGAGKTAIAAELIRRADPRLLGYHFCLAGMADSLQPENFVRSLAGMIATSVDSYQDRLFRLRAQPALLAAPPEQLFRQLILDPLGDIPATALPGVAPAYLLVDGLDEALHHPGGEAGSIARLLARMAPHFPPWLKLLVTARSDARIQAMFAHARMIPLDAGEDGQRADLDHYIDHRLQDAAMQAALPDAAERQRAAALVKRHSDGSFIYAASALDYLQEEGLPPGAATLPSGLAELYYRRADARFGEAELVLERRILATLLAAREPLTATQLAGICDAPADALWPALGALTIFVSAEPGPHQERAYRIAHKSMSDWLTSAAALRYRVQPDAAPLLAFCRSWRATRDSYALRHVIGHLLQAQQPQEALAQVTAGLFAERAGILQAPRLDLADSRDLAVQLVQARDRKGLMALAWTSNRWQRDGVTLALQSMDDSHGAFIDELVGALLERQA